MKRNAVGADGRPHRPAREPVLGVLDELPSRYQLTVWLGAGFTLRTYTHLMEGSSERTKRAIIAALLGKPDADDEPDEDEEDGEDPES